MPDIKTKETVRDIKVLDRSRIVSEHMKKALIHAKDTAQNLMDDGQITPEEYASDRIKYAAQEAANSAGNAVSSGMRRAKNRLRRSDKTVHRGANEKTRRARRPEPVQTAIKQSPRSAGTQTIKTRDRVSKAVGGARKPARQVKTAAKTQGKAIKTATKSARAAKQASVQTAKATAKMAEQARRAAYATAKTAKAIATALAKAVKAIIAAMKELGTAIAAGGWVSVIVIVVILVVGIIAGSVYGLFLSNEDTGTGMRMRDAVAMINNEYQTEIQRIKAENTHDDVELTGSRAIWKDVLAVYAVKVIADPEKPQEVASMDEEKYQILRQVFWDMNEITWHVETITETVTEEETDEDGNPVVTETTRTSLHINVKHRTPEEMAEEYGFTDEQRILLMELLSEENESLWSSAFYGVNGDGNIVDVARSQVGNTGETYWSYMGFHGRVEWCACFVSWCANECGYIESDIIPRFSLCESGANWFKDRSRWLDAGDIPTPGSIIFFDWNHNGETDHVGIVEKVEGSTVWTVEGNSNDSVEENSYSITSSSIYGYGIPDYA